ncbi:hypothetical protein CCUS01_15445 [Colletotrichum cuscutae]|uniref:DUF7907 domain-containing protein n=1 Tax=Colletotrichum cuscutae TaxID=1209917 RepID=A0AAI9VFY1_9PEZI|nr:hypothetical protein CCUS01_15445 [Colletotrichum cuscutae]
MIIRAILKTTVLAAGATAATISARNDDGTNSFRLWANMLYPDSPGNGPIIQGYELGYVSDAACQATVILVPESQGSMFYANNNTLGVDFGGDSSSFSGMVVPWRGSAMVPSGRPVELKCEDGTQGLTLNENGVYYPGEMGPDFNGAFMVCENGAEPFLSFYGWGQRPLWGCTVIQLLPIY